MSVRDSRGAGVRVLVLTALPAVVMAALGWWRIRRGDSLYSGECATFWAGHLALPDLLRLLGHVDAVHGTYYALMHVAFWFGHNALMLRLPSLVAAVGTVVLTSLVTFRLTGSRATAFVAAALVALAPTMSQYAQSGRSYALVCMLALAAGLALLHAVALPGPATRTGAGLLRWALYGVLMVAVGYLHEVTFALLAAAHGTTLLWARPGRRAFVRWVVTSALALVLLLPLLLVSVREDGAISRLTPPTWRTVGQLVQVFLGPSPVVLGVLAALVVLGALPLGRRATDPDTPLAVVPGLPRGLTLQSFALPLLVVPSVLLLVESLVAKPLYAPRYLLFSLPGAMMLAAAGLERVATLVRARGGARAGARAAWVPAGLVIVGVLTLQWSDQVRLRTPEAHGWDLVQAADYLQPRVRPGDGIDYVPRAYSYLGTTYPQAVRGTYEYRLRQGPRASGTLHGLVKRHAALRRAMLTHERVWLVGDKPFRPGADQGRFQLQLLDRYYTPVSAHAFPGGVVTLFERRPRTG